MKKNNVLYCLVILFICVTLCFAAVAKTTLEKLIINSDCIVIGKVVKIERNGFTSIAEVEIIKLFNGKPDLKKLYYLAQGTWLCDISMAVEGETSLLFLRNAPDDEHLSAAKSISATPFFHVSHAGRGRMPVKKIENDEYVNVWVRNVKLPDSIKVFPEPEKETIIERYALLEDMKNYIEKIVQPYISESQPYYYSGPLDVLVESEPPLSKTPATTRIMPTSTVTILIIIAGVILIGILIVIIVIKKTNNPSNL